MPNPIIDMMQRSNPVGRAVSQATEAEKLGPLWAILKLDPRMQQVYDYVNQNGGNPQQAFYKLAQEQGENPIDILNRVLKQAR